MLEIAGGFAVFWLIGYAVNAFLNWIDERDAASIRKRRAERAID